MRIATMNTAVATKMPIFSPLAPCGSSGPTTGLNKPARRVRQQRTDKRHEQRVPRVGEKEQQQRAHLERELEEGIELLFRLCGHGLAFYPGDRVGEILGGEGRQIVHALADADEMHR